jgi:hypothetical protein
MVCSAVGEKYILEKYTTLLWLKLRAKAVPLHATKTLGGEEM